MRQSVSVILDKRTKSTTGENAGKYPIKIKVNFKSREGRKNKYQVRRFQTGVFAKEGEFNRKKNDPAVIIALGKATELFKNGLGINEFERLFTGSGGLENIKTTFDYIIDRLRAEGRDGTALAYSNALSSFKKYKGEFIAFGSITVEWLKDYERWMKKERIEGEGKQKKIIKAHSINTIGIYCRALRTIFNQAIDLKIISRESFPFGVRKFVIPSGKRQIRKAYSGEEKNIILLHRSAIEEVNKGLDYWAYQFFSDGCNMADVAYLKFKDIDGDFLSFDRKKTENTEREKQSIDVYINPRMREVINKWGNKSLDPNAYVFPIINQDMTSRQRKEAIRQFIKDINALLSLAQAEINKEKEVLKIKLTTGTARYTAPTLLKRHGIDLKVIAKTMGHGSEATTSNYTEDERETQMLISKTLSL
jgi:integrase